ncbi:MAG: ABC transporter ATP-binding protein [Porticoccaceae bacterium]
MIRAQNLCKTHRQGEREVVAVHDFSITLKSGEFAALMGESGAGKTTVLQILGCLDQPCGGRYWFDGERVDTMAEQRLAAIRNRMIGFVFQTSHFIDYLDMTDNIALPGFYAMGGNHAAQRARARELLQCVGLGQRTAHLPSALSGGERQRAAIARALFNEPKLLLADEPTGNLDSANTLHIMDILKTLHRDGLSILLVTHDSAVAARADRIIHIGQSPP